MLDGLVPDLAPRLLIAIGGVAVAFLVLIAVLMFLRRRNSPLFIKGGRVREHRLLVLDAAAVDAKRRLVLIRRDDTEHLIMIGGPSDLVIETGISAGGRQKAAVAQPAAEKPVAVQRPVAVEKPAVTPVAAARPVPAAAAATSGQPNPAAQADAMRRRQGQNGDAAQQQRRQERQAARAAEAAKLSGPQIATVSAMGAVLYGEGRESQKNDAKAPAQAVDAKPAETDDAQQRAVPAAAQAENVLDLARERVLHAHPGYEKTPGNEEAIRQLEQQLEAGKAETARVEAAKAEAARTEAARQEAARLEAERVAAVRADAERAEAVRAEAARLETARIEAQKAEAAKREAERAESERLESERAQAEREEAARAEEEAARLEAQQAEAARAEAARLESQRVAAARAEAMARFEAARRAQAEQKQAAQVVQPVAEQQPAVTEPAAQQPQWPIVEPPVAEAAAVEREPAETEREPAVAKREEETASLEQEGSKSQERLASDFEKLLEAELEADGILDNYPAPTVAGERREQGLGAPSVNPVQRDSQPITGAVPGVSIEHDMARRLGEISLNKKTDAL